MFILTEMCLKIRALKTDSTFAGLYLQCNTVLGVTCERWWICKLITIPVRPNEYLKTMPLMRITGHRPEPHLLLNMFNYKTKHMLSRCPEKLLVTKYPPSMPTRTVFPSVLLHNTLIFHWVSLWRVVFPATGAVTQPSQTFEDDTKPLKSPSVAHKL